MNKIIILEQAELERMIHRIVQETVAQLRQPETVAQIEEWWDAKAVGEYLGVSPWTITYKWSHHPDFPKALELGSGHKNARRRWRADEVRQWAEKKKQAG